jgi:YbgC/YbaW family acyl-CoA thioester hydrolase
MKNYHSFNIDSRFFDLDSQHHVNNASYLSYVREGQLSYLKNLGYGSDYLVNHKIYLRPEIIHVSFLRQQRSQAPLEIRTAVYRIHNSIYWDQEIYNRETRELSVHLATLLSTGPHCLDKIEQCRDNFPAPLITWNILENFSGDCKRSLMEYRVRHIDLDRFNLCADTVLWRLNEEARWSFMTETNVSFGHLLENDTALFWINGVYHYYSDVKLNDSLQIYTWISRRDNVRFYIRQEIVKNNNESVLRCDGEFVTVSISRSRPKRIPDYLKSAFQPYMEKVE